MRIESVNAKNWDKESWPWECALNSGDCGSSKISNFHSFAPISFCRYGKRQRGKCFSRWAYRWAVLSCTACTMSPYPRQALCMNINLLWYIYKFPFRGSPVPTNTFLYAQSWSSRPAIAIIGGNLKGGSSDSWLAMLSPSFFGNGLSGPRAERFVPSGCESTARISSRVNQRASVIRNWGKFRHKRVLVGIV